MNSDSSNSDFSDDEIHPNAHVNWVDVTVLDDHTPDPLPDFENNEGI